MTEMRLFCAEAILNVKVRSRMKAKAVTALHFVKRRKCATMRGKKYGCRHSQATTGREKRGHPQFVWMV